MLKNLLNVPAVKAAAQTALSRTREYAAFLRDNEPVMHPDHYAARLRGMIESAESPEEAQSLLEALAKLSRPGAKEYAHVCRVKAMGILREVKAAWIHALSLAKAELEKGREAAIEAEKAFFSAHGVAPEQTGVARRFDVPLKLTTEQITGLQNEGGTHLTHPSNLAVLGLFGISL